MQNSRFVSIFKNNELSMSPTCTYQHGTNTPFQPFEKKSNFQWTSTFQKRIYPGAGEDLDPGHWGLAVAELPLHGQLRARGLVLAGGGGNWRLAGGARVSQNEVDFTHKIVYISSIYICVYWIIWDNMWNKSKSRSSSFRIRAWPNMW